MLILYDRYRTVKYGTVPYHTVPTYRTVPVWDTIIRILRYGMLLRLRFHTVTDLPWYGMVVWNRTGTVPRYRTVRYDMLTTWHTVQVLYRRTVPYRTVPGQVPQVPYRTVPVPYPYRTLPHCTVTAPYPVPSVSQFTHTQCMDDDRPHNFY